MKQAQKLRLVRQLANRVVVSIPSHGK